MHTFFINKHRLIVAQQLYPYPLYFYLMRKCLSFTHFKRWFVNYVYVHVLLCMRVCLHSF